MPLTLVRENSTYDDNSGSGGVTDIQVTGGVSGDNPTLVVAALHYASLTSEENPTINETVDYDGDTMIEDGEAEINNSPANHDVIRSHIFHISSPSDGDRPVNFSLDHSVSYMLGYVWVFTGGGSLASIRESEHLGVEMDVTQPVPSGGYMTGCYAGGSSREETNHNLTEDQVNSDPPGWSQYRGRIYSYNNIAGGSEVDSVLDLHGGTPLFPIAFEAAYVGAAWIPAIPAAGFDDEEFGATTPPDTGVGAPWTTSPFSQLAYRFGLPDPYSVYKTALEIGKTYLNTRIL